MVKTHLYADLFWQLVLQWLQIVLESTTPDEFLDLEPIKPQKFNYTPEGIREKFW